MYIIACLDNRNGMLFGGRRQSTDRALREQVLRISENSRLWMNPYSAKQFAEESRQIYVDADFLSKASTQDYCFVENTEIAPYREKITGVILYRWNRDYPADKKFPMELFEKDWECTSRRDFRGFSHETITEEIYCL